jgi:hypothetical protein
MPAAFAAAWLAEFPADAEAGTGLTDDAAGIPEDLITGLAAAGKSVVKSKEFVSMIGVVGAETKDDAPIA